MDSNTKAKTAVRTAKAKWGHGWSLLSEEQRQGAIALQLVSLLILQDEEAASPALLRLQEVVRLALGM